MKNNFFTALFIVMTRETLVLIPPLLSTTLSVDGNRLTITQCESTWTTYKGRFIFDLDEAYF